MSTAQKPTVEQREQTIGALQLAAKAAGIAR